MQNPERLSLGEQNLNIRFAQPQQAQLPNYERSTPLPNSSRSSRASNSESAPPPNLRTTQQPAQPESIPTAMVLELKQLKRKMNEVLKTIDEGGQLLVKKIQDVENKQQQMSLFIFEQQGREQEAAVERERQRREQEAAAERERQRREQDAAAERERVLERQKATELRHIQQQQAARNKALSLR